MKALFKLAALVPGLLLFEACVKKTAELEPDDGSVNESFVATGFATDMGNIADEAGRTKNISSFKTADAFATSGPCASLKFDTLASGDPDSITVNFGAVNCLCNDKRYRRGALLIVYNGKYRDSLASITITPQNYFVDNYGISGSKSIRNEGHNAAGHLVYTINEQITITKPAGAVLKMNSRRQREWLSGENTNVWYDDRYAITGSGTGTSSAGRGFQFVITSPLIKDMKFECRKHFIGGVLVHTPTNRPGRYIDFGDGVTCDNKATVTINGRSQEVELP